MRLSGIGEGGLRLAAGLCLRRRGRLAGVLAALRLASALRFGPRLYLRLGGGLGFGLQCSLGLAYLLKPLLLVGHPIRHLVAALVAVELVLLRIGSLGSLEPASHLRLEPCFPLLHAIVAHPLVLLLLC